MQKICIFTTARKERGTKKIDEKMHEHASNREGYVESLAENDKA